MKILIYITAEPPAAIKVQCAYSIEPKTTRKKPSRKISDPISHNPTTIAFKEPNEPEVVDLEPETSQVNENDIIVTKEPPQKLNDDSTKTTPWWWQFTLQNNDQDGGATTFPPWFQEVEATEFPAWIKKTVTPSDNIRKEKEDIVERIRLKENLKRRKENFLKSDKRLGEKNKVEKNPKTQDLVHGNNIHSGQQREIQISRHFRLPQQSLPSKYHAARQPGKFKMKHKSNSSRTYTSRSNFTIPLRRPIFKTNMKNAKTPNNVHEVVNTPDPTSYPDYETTTQTEKHNKPPKSNAKVSMFRIDEIERTDKIHESKRVLNRIPELRKELIPNNKIRNLSPKATARINQQREFLNKVRKQKNQWRKLRSQSEHSRKRGYVNRKWVTNRVNSLYPAAKDNNELDLQGNDFSRRIHYQDSLADNNNNRKDTEDDNVKVRNNFKKFNIFKADVEPDRIEIDEEDITFKEKYKDVTEAPRADNDDSDSIDDIETKLYRRPRPRLNRFRKIADNRWQKGDLRDTLHKDYFPTMTPDNFEHVGLLPNSRVTQIAEIFRPNTVHTSNLIQMFESKKTQLTLLEPTPPGSSTKRVQPPLYNSRFVQSSHEQVSPSGDSENFVLNSSPSLPYSVPIPQSTTMSKTAKKDAIKSAKNKSKLLAQYHQRVSANCFQFQVTKSQFKEYNGTE